MAKLIVSELDHGEHVALTDLEMGQMFIGSHGTAFLVIDADSIPHGRFTGKDGRTLAAIWLGRPQGPCLETSGKLIVRRIIYGPVTLTATTKKV